MPKEIGTLQELQDELGDLEREDKDIKYELCSSKEDDEEYLLLELLEKTRPIYQDPPLSSCQSYLDEKKISTLTTTFYTGNLISTSFDMLFYGFLVVYGVFQNFILSVIAIFAVVVIMVLLGTSVVGTTKKFGAAMLFIGYFRLCYDIILLCFSLLAAVILLIVSFISIGDDDDTSQNTLIHRFIFLVIFFVVITFYLIVSGVCIASSIMLGKLFQKEAEKYSLPTYVPLSPVIYYASPSLPPLHILTSSSPPIPPPTSLTIQTSQPPLPTLPTLPTQLQPLAHQPIHNIVVEKTENSPSSDVTPHHTPSFVEEITIIDDEENHAYDGDDSANDDSDDDSSSSSSSDDDGDDSDEQEEDDV